MEAAANRTAAIQAMIEKALGDLPPLPTVVTKVLQITGNVNGNASELEKYISMDQAMSTKMLRVVNSPYFGLSGQVSSISHAVVILGFNQIRNLVLSVGATQMFTTESPKAQPTYLYLWKHAMATAGAAQAISRLRRLSSKDAELAFIGGLLSNVGGLFLLKYLTVPYLQMFERFASSEGKLSEWEQHVFEMTHAHVAFELAKAWKLPEDLALIVGRHEDKFAGDPIPSLYCVQAADRLAQMVIKEINEPGVIKNLDPAVAAWLNATPEEVELLKGETKIKLQATDELLGDMI